MMNAKKIVKYNKFIPNICDVLISPDSQFASSFDFHFMQT